MKQRFYLKKETLDVITKAIESYNEALGRVAVMYEWKVCNELDDTYELSIIPEDLLDMYNVGRLAMVE